MTPATSQTWEWLRQRARQRQAAGLRRQLAPRAADDRRVDLASNDYLSLASDPRIVEAAIEAVRTWGAGATGSRLVSGSTDLHQELEESLAGLCGTQAGLVFSSGYLANLGAVTALTDADTLVLSDNANHASLIDACRLSKAHVAIYPSGETAAVARVLAARSLPKAVIVTDAVYSVDGQLAPLAELHRAARAHDAVLLVDEAHSLGVLGPAGSGAVAAAGLSGEPDIVITATLSKALASQGGAVLGTRDVIEHLVDSARSMIFDTGLAPGSVGAALAAVKVLLAEPDLAERCRSIATHLHRVLLDAGFNSAPPSAAVTSALIGSPIDALAAQRSCHDAGVAVGCFRPPSVPDAWSRLRITAHAGLTEMELARGRRALQAAAREVRSA